MSEGVGKRVASITHRNPLAIILSILGVYQGVAGIEHLPGINVHPNAGRERQGKASRGAHSHNQPSYRLDARHFNHHPAHHRKLDMSKRYARAGSGG